MIAMAVAPGRRDDCREKPLLSQASISRTSSRSISPLRTNQRTTRTLTCSVMAATASGIRT
jgi:hypothetical protein